MSDWLLNLPVLAMGAIILGAIYLVTAGLYRLIMSLALGERARAFKAISPGMLPPLAIIFALLVGFLAAQVWNDADRASGAVNREASALRAIVLLSGAFPGGPETRMRELVRDHIQEVVRNGRQWPGRTPRSRSPRRGWSKRSGSRSRSRPARRGSSRPSASWWRRSAPRSSPAGNASY
jgi:hypothetical protein